MNHTIATLVLNALVPAWTCLERRGLDANPGCLASLVGELKQANNVIEPACNLI